jgi:uncharacterized protein (UPF0335 family)
MNSNVTVTSIDDSDLFGFVQRIESLTEEMKTFSDDIKEVYQEIKNKGYDTGIIRQIIKDRAKPESEIEEKETIKDAYKRAINTAENRKLSK